MIEEIIGKRGHTRGMKPISIQTEKTRKKFWLIIYGLTSEMQILLLKPRKDRKYVLEHAIFFLKYSIIHSKLHKPDQYVQSKISFSFIWQEMHKG